MSDDISIQEYFDKNPEKKPDETKLAALRTEIDIVANELKAARKKSRQPTDPELIQCLAEVLGQGVVEWSQGPDDDSSECVEVATRASFDPLRDANQMEMVEDAIRHQYKRLSMTTHWGGSNYHVTIRPYGKGEYEVLDTNKKRAFALAVWEMRSQSTT